MSATKKLIVGNWKMNLNIHEASIFVHKLAKEIEHDLDEVTNDIQLVKKSFATDKEL